ncbi:MAG: hypothetical protein JAY94_11905 [Candidatus Thiodiazotropha endolucinida]|nr:hypothetical protein [Candidatus Thiodiazotropha taylori]MCW4318213.1 hypothetical protein [Candidatus Thiodiazotropha taylori]
MEAKETVNPVEIALFRIDGIVRKSHCNQKAPVEIGMSPGQVVLGIIDRFFDHLISARDCYMFAFQGAGTIQPHIPIELATPRLA